MYVWDCATGKTKSYARYGISWCDPGVIIIKMPNGAGGGWVKCRLINAISQVGVSGILGSSYGTDS